MICFIRVVLVYACAGVRLKRVSGQSDPFAALGHGQHPAIEDETRA
jgi:hypothetical protein